jgi:hypothetical protein
VRGGGQHGGAWGGGGGGGREEAVCKEWGVCGCRCRVIVVEKEMWMWMVIAWIEPWSGARCAGCISWLGVGARLCSCSPWVPAVLGGWRRMMTRWDNLLPRLTQPLPYAVTVTVTTATTFPPLPHSITTTISGTRSTPKYGLLLLLPLGVRPEHRHRLWPVPPPDRCVSSPTATDTQARASASTPGSSSPSPAPSRGRRRASGCVLASACSVLDGAWSSCRRWRELTTGASTSPARVSWVVVCARPVLGRRTSSRECAESLWRIGADHARSSTR